MTWERKVRGLPPVSDDELRKVVEGNKPVGHALACRLVNAILTSRDAIPPVTTTDDQNDDDTPSQAADAGANTRQLVKRTVRVNVSSEDGKTPWHIVLKKAEKDDRLKLAIEEGIITPVEGRAEIEVEDVPGTEPDYIDDEGFVHFRKVDTKKG